MLNRSALPLGIISIVFLLLESIPGVGLINYSPLLLLGAVLLCTHYKKLSKLQLVISAFAIITLTVLIYRFSPAFSRFLADKCSGRYLLFSVVNTVYETLITTDFGELFYHSGYSRAILTNRGILSGAVDIAGEVSSTVISQYLTGKYIITLFLPIGLLTLKTDKKLLASLMLMCVIAGDSRMLSAFVLFYSPALFISYVAVTGLAYAACATMDIRIPFETAATVFEFVKHIEQPVFFILIGCICAVILLFVSLYIDGRFHLINKADER